VTAVLQEELTQVVDDNHVVGRVLVAENRGFLHLDALVLEEPEKGRGCILTNYDDHLVESA